MKVKFRNPFPDRRPFAPATAVFLAAVFLLVLPMPAAAQEDAAARQPGPGLDVKAVLGPNACAQCHKRGAEVWRKTAHHRVFRETHRSSRGRAFARSLGIRRIKDPEALCATCHYTVRAGEKRARAIAGISCESCHGAGRDWVRLHSEYSGKNRETESAQETASRWMRSEKAGMVRPRNLYDMARNCYSCHATAHEELVNVAGHPPGRALEMLSWTMGEVRHNVWYTPANDEASPERRRMLYLAGLALSLETSLEALSSARTAGGAYAANLGARIDHAREGIAKVAARLAGPEEIKAMVAAAPRRGAAAKQLKAAAATVAAQARRLLQRGGADLEAIDDLLPGAADYVGKVVQP